MKVKARKPAPKLTPEQELRAQFAKNLQAARDAVGMTQHGLANAIGISAAYVSLLERARRTPSLDTIGKLARAVQVAPSDLLL